MPPDPSASSSRTRARVAEHPKVDLVPIQVPGPVARDEPFPSSVPRFNVSQVPSSSGPAVWSELSGPSVAPGWCSMNSQLNPQPRERGAPLVPGLPAHGPRIQGMSPGPLPSGPHGTPDQRLSQLACPARTPAPAAGRALRKARAFLTGERGCDFEAARGRPRVWGGTEAAGLVWSRSLETPRPPAGPPLPGRRSGSSPSPEAPREKGPVWVSLFPLGASLTSRRWSWKHADACLGEQTGR